MKQKDLRVQFSIVLLSVAMVMFAMHGCEPVGSPSVITVQAEDAYYNSALVETDYAGYTGRGYVNTTNAAGTFLEWTINASIADNDAQCTITFANGGGTSRGMEVSVNGNVAISRLDFPDNGSWDIWRTTLVSIPLSAGTNTLRFTSLDSGGAPNLDKIDISSIGTLTLEDTTPPEPTGNITVWMAGDSTMANGRTPCPVGYGKMFNSFFDNRVTVINRARGGRSINNWMYKVLDTSSRNGDCNIERDASGNLSVTDDWQAMLNGMQPGDYLFISFGINDSTSACPRHAGEATFKKDLRTMAEAARARGANPVFMTPVSAIACNGRTARPTRGGYVDYTLAVGRELNVTVINLHQLSVNVYNALGFCPLPYGAADVSASTGGAVGTFFCDDHTHFDTTGATRIGQLIADAIANQRLSLAAYLK